MSSTAVPASYPSQEDRPAIARRRPASSAPVPAAAPAAPAATAGFQALGLPADLDAVLQRLGLTTPTPIQALTIGDALAGRDVCGKAQTGSGKTLAFGLPLIARTTTARRRRPRALVLVPTRELANQVAEALTPFAAERGLWLSTVYGGVSMVRQVRALQAGVDVVIATPGRLNDLLEQGELSVADVEFVVLDEANQMSDMGFLPQVQRILDRVEGQPQTLLFSATLDGAIGTLVRRYQHDPVHHAVAAAVESTDAMDQRFIGVLPAERIAVTAAICAAAERSLVFVSTTRGADRLAEHLERTGLRCAAIHGRLAQNRRERVLASFASGATPVLIATNVAARGIHVDGVDVVVHYDPPEDAKVYLHRSGRTARAGDRGLVVTLAQPEHERDITRLIQEVGIDHDIVRMRPDDERLADLAAWEPPASTAGPVSGTYSVRKQNRGGGGGNGARRGAPPVARPASPRSRTPAGRARRRDARW